MSPIANAAEFLVNVFFNAFLMLLLLRFLFQLVKVDFYNPIAQFIVKITNPLLVPMRRIIPGLAGLDLATLILLLIIQIIELIILILLRGIPFDLNLGFLLGVSMWATGEILNICTDVYTFGIIVLVILSWLPTHGYNPLLALLYQFISPAMRPFQRFIKPIAGLDLSPFFLLIAIQLIVYLLIHPLIAYGRLIMIS